MLNWWVFLFSLLKKLVAVSLGICSRISTDSVSKKSDTDMPSDCELEKIENRDRILGSFYYLYILRLQTALL